MRIDSIIRNAEDKFHAWRDREAQILISEEWSSDIEGEPKEGVELPEWLTKSIIAAVKAGTTDSSKGYCCWMDVPGATATALQLLAGDYCRENAQCFLKKEIEDLKATIKSGYLYKVLLRKIVDALPDEFLALAMESASEETANDKRDKCAVERMLLSAYLVCLSANDLFARDKLGKL